MKKLDKRRFNTFFIRIFLFIVIILALFYIGVFKKTCLKESCFDESLTKCEPAQFVKQKNNNLYTYSISRSLSDECKVYIKFERAAPGSDPDIMRLEGKSMKCKIPKSILINTNLDEVDNILEYCHGELKEGILELVIKRMYNLLIENLDEVVKESKEFLKGV